MEQLDRDLQKRVWQRVQGGQSMPSLGRLNLKPWILAAQENAQAYRSLSQEAAGREAEQLRRLYGESQRCIACLKGICRLRGEKLKLNPLPPEREGRRSLLESCYRRERGLWQQLEQQAAEPEHGAVFDRLSRQAQEHCVTLMELLGTMP